MNKISIKSLIAIPLALLAFGVLPVLLLPIGQYPIFNAMPYEMSDIHDLINTGWPMFFDAYHVAKVEFVLLLPVVFILYSLLKGKKAYHGIWALFLVIGLAIKASNMDATNMGLLCLMGVFATLNTWAYLEYHNESLDDWLRYKFGRRAKMRQATGAQSNDDSGVVNEAQIARKNFSNVVGMEEFKARLLKAGLEVISNDAKSPKRNGILLTGDPGNGKTTMAEALAGELKLPIISVAFGTFASSWVGQTTERVMKVFDDAIAQAPCVLFLDEIEAVMVDRSKVTNGDSEAPKTVSAMLKRLEDIRDSKVVVIGASNFLDRLDPAAIREGRFDYKIEVPPPDFEARKFLLNNGLKSVFDKVDTNGLERAAKRWEGFAVSRINAIVTETLDQIKEGKINEIGFDELASALRRLNASMGDKIPENALSIDQLIMTPEMRSRMKKLASRMINIDAIEEMGGSVPSGVLFLGPAGTGKTVSAMALAKESKWAFLQTSGHDLLHSPEKMDTLMRRAKDMRPCIVFIDEADDVLADRRNSILSKDVTNKLLTIMDGAGGRTKDILFIAATNAPDLIDDAMLRGGRFTEKVTFDVPDEDSLHGYVTKWIANTKAKLNEDFTADAIVELLNGESLANVGEILQSAVNEAIETGEDKNFRVNLSHVRDAYKLIKG